MNRSVSTSTPPRPARAFPRGSGRAGHPAAAYRQRGGTELVRDPFTAPEVWHEPREDGRLRFRVQPAGRGYIHPVTVDEVRERLSRLPNAFTAKLELVQLSGMTLKRRRFPCYGMQWGAAVYLYPMESTLIERYVRPPTPQQKIEARMYGGEWSYDGRDWWLTWTPETIRDFYLNNVLIHEVGHLNDLRNDRSEDREKYANWFAIEHGYRASRGRK